MGFSPVGGFCDHVMHVNRLVRAGGVSLHREGAFSMYKSLMLIYIYMCSLSVNTPAFFKGVAWSTEV